MIYRLATVCILLISYSFALRGQEMDVIDSLRAQLKEANDTTRMNLFFELSMSYQFTDPDSAMYFATEAINRSREINYLKGEADGLISAGRLKRDKGQYADALEDIFASLEIYREINDTKQIANAFNDISIVYAISEDYEQSLVYFQKALSLFQQMGDEQGESYALNNLGIIYQELGDDSTARDYFVQSLRIKEKNNDLYGISRAYTNLGSILENYEQWDAALVYYFKADSVYHIREDRYGEASNFISIANLYVLKQELGRARRYAERGMQTAETIESNPIRQDAASVLVSIYEGLGNYKKALEYQKLYQQVTDSLLNAENLENIEGLKAQFNAAEKEMEIADLKKEQALQKALVERRTLLNYMLIGGVLLLLLSLAFLYSAYSANKNKKNALITLNRDKDRFLSILSHDIKSPLNTLKGFSSLLMSPTALINKEEIQTYACKINHSLEKLTELVDDLLKWSMSRTGKNDLQFQPINMNDLVQNVVDLYQLTANSKRIQIVTEAESQVFGFADYNSLHTVLRNLLSNGIKFSHPESTIYIKTTSENGRVKTSIKDSGIGMKKEMIENLFSLSKDRVRSGTADEKGTGLGLALSRELITENKGELVVTSERGMGSEFSVIIPAYSNNKTVPHASAS